MKLKALAALPLVVALSASPVYAGALGAVVIEPEPAPVVVAPPPGGLNHLAVAGAIAGVALVCILACGSSSSATTTPAAVAQ